MGDRRVPTLIRVPRSESVLRDLGAYPATISLGQETTSTQRKLAKHGLHGFEPGTQSTLLTLVQLAGPRPVHFFDVGAHIGSHALVIASVYPASAVKVTAFEPTPKTAAVCRALAGANDLEIRVERAAISDTDGTASLFISPWETSNSLQKGFRPARGTVDVPSIKLDTYCAQRGVLPSVIKIDVESYESHVVRGATQVLAQGRPAVVCEILRDTDPATIEQTVTPFVSNGYHLYRWSPIEGWSECEARQVVEQIEHVGNDWLFMPEAVDDRFRTALGAWREAVAGCKPKWNEHVAPGDAHRPRYHDIRPRQRLGLGARRS
jgi:FkbM family methyltransferase